MFIINTIRTFYLYLFSEWGSIPLRSKKVFSRYFFPAIENLRTRDIKYKEARDAGLFYTIETLESLDFPISNFEKMALEYGELNDRATELLNDSIKNSKYPRLLFLMWALRQPISPYGSWFSKIDEMYLLAQYLFARDNGATEVQAVHWAHKWLPFQPAKFLPPLARFSRKTNFGQCWSLVFYSIPRLLETFFTRPWVIFGTLITITFFLILWPIAGVRSVFISQNKT